VLVELYSSLATPTSITRQFKNQNQTKMNDMMLHTFSEQLLLPLPATSGTSKLQHPDQQAML